MAEIRSKLILFAISIVLSSCSSNHRTAPVVDRYSPAERAPKHYVITPGDTLFSIAWRYGLVVEGLGAANNIASPYTIYPGQRIVLREARIKPVVPKRPAKKAVATAPKNPIVTVKRDTRVSVPSAKSTISSVNNRWLWPAKGKIIRGFLASGQAHKGIDLEGKIGEPVRASRGGEVAYAGSGLIGYGKLIILRHPNNLLSAYGHNSRLLVKEGDVVKAGKVIAKLGDSGTSSAKLHFEIRKNGKPIDPRKLLSRQRE